LGHEAPLPPLLLPPLQLLPPPPQQLLLLLLPPLPQRQTLVARVAQELTVELKPRHRSLRRSWFHAHRYLAMARRCRLQAAAAAAAATAATAVAAVA